MTSDGENIKPGFPLLFRCYNMYECMHTCVFVCMCVCQCMSVNACVYVCVSVSVCLSPESFNNLICLAVCLACPVWGQTYCL